MNRKDLIGRLKAISLESEARDDDWYSNAKGGVELLQQSLDGEEIVIYATLSAHTYIHAVLAPVSKTITPDFDDLTNLCISPDRSWIIEHVSGGGKPDRIYLRDPMSDTGSESLEGGEKLIFSRSFTGVSDCPNTIEINQKLVHSLDLFFMADRNAYCRLDEKGDIREIIKVIDLLKGRDPLAGHIVTIKANDLHEYMVLAHYNLIYSFDFTRYRFDSFANWSEETYGTESGPDVYYKFGFGPSASFVHGKMVARSPITYEDVRAKRMRTGAAPKQYAVFKVQDWRHKRLIEIECTPQNMTNYFVKTEELPFEVSPVFFRPEVLAKYKADPEKYPMSDRTISCRNSWYLKTYDINAEGQVHTYLIYLSQLPYEEQLYWQSFNEWPKSGISKRAIENDFHGTWSTEYDALASLKRKTQAFDEASPNWWKPRGEALIQTVHLPATESSNEWADEIMRLDQMLVEGFQPGPLREILNKKAHSFDKSWASLRLLQEVFVAEGESSTEAEAIMQPLRSLHFLRTKIKGHSAPSERRALEGQARREHETFRAHFLHLAAACDASMKRIADLLASSQQD